MAALVREIAMSRAELLTRLENVLGHNDYVLEGHDVHVRDGDKRIEIKMVTDDGGAPGRTVETNHQVQFLFANMSDDEVRAFMQRWDDEAGSTAPPT